MAPLASTRKQLERKVDALVPACITWPEQQVATWISDLGFPQYKLCFLDNFVNGRKLIHIDMCSLPEIGITNYEHMKIISKAIRNLFGIPGPNLNRSVALPRKEALELYLEAKSRTGAHRDRLTFARFLHENSSKLRTHID